MRYSAIVTLVIVLKPNERNLKAKNSIQNNTLPAYVHCNSMPEAYNMRGYEDNMVEYNYVL